MRAKFYLLICLFIISGCATPMVANLEKHNNHYIPTSDPTKGVMYIYRDSEYMGCLRGLYINANGKRIGALNSGTYFVHESDPGDVEVSIEDWLGKNPSRRLKVEAGESYYLKAGIKFGFWDADPYIYIVANEEGQRAIRELIYATMREKDLELQNRKDYSEE